jgi:HEAT repeat protein
MAPTIGIIEIYGLRKVPAARLRKALGIVEGDKLPGNKPQVEDRLAEVPGVVSASISAACCTDGQAILYVGIEEKGARHFDVRTPPEDDVVLPDMITEYYRKFIATVADAARKGEAAEDLTEGHSLLSDPDARDIQLRFVALADKYPAELRTVLRTSGDDEQRAIAAYILGYATDRASVVDDLQYALKDPDDTVRGNAIRALAALVVYAALNPDSGIKISPTWFVEMLNSVYWTDRNNAAVALVNMTESRDASSLQQLRERALPSLIEMAKWKHLAHALPSYILLGRVAGMPEKEIQDSWSNNQRNQTIAAIMKKLK